MTRLALALLALVSAAAASAQDLVTVNPSPAGSAWWLRAEFHALHREIRGIPVAKIRADWCKATEFSRELFPKDLLVENGADLLTPYGLSFSLQGAFDGTARKQTALVGTYETCAGQKGRFFLILDSGTQNIRFLDAEITKDRFSALGKDGRAIRIVYCLECDISALVRWDRKRKRFRVKPGSAD